VVKKPRNGRRPVLYRYVEIKRVNGYLKRVVMNMSTGKLSEISASRWALLCNEKRIKF
jgi:hypothetical protein